MNNILTEIRDRNAFRRWLAENGKTEKECWLCLKRGRPTDDGAFYYLDAVEEALCFGWIDSTQKPIDGVMMQRFTPRAKNSFWSELNKERVRRLIAIGGMTDTGASLLPDLGRNSFAPDSDVTDALKNAGVYNVFLTFPELYQRVRLYNIAFYKKRNPAAYEKALRHCIEETQKHRMYGEWNDYGRLGEKYD